MDRVRGRIARTRRRGRWAFRLVLAVSVLLGLPLVHGVVVALGLGRPDLTTWGLVGVAILAAVDVLAWVLVRRQQRLLDSAEEIVREMETADWA